MTTAEMNKPHYGTPAWLKLYGKVSVLTGEVVTPYDAERHRRLKYTRDHPRMSLDYGTKVRIIERQNGKCNRCDHIINTRIKATTWVDTRTGEIKTRSGNYVNKEHEKLLDWFVGYPLCDIEFHHIIPLCEGGPDALANIEALCYDCHLKAHGKKPKKWLGK